jgi:two-component system, repressor protein LuxO
MTQAASDGEIVPLWLIEKRAIEHAINLCQGNIPKAAELLRISPSTIYRKRQAWAAGEEG